MLLFISRMLATCVVALTLLLVLTIHDQSASLSASFILDSTLFVHDFRFLDICVFLIGLYESLKALATPRYT